MSTEKTRIELQALKDSLIRSNGVGGLTRASEVRTLAGSLIVSLSNILDDKDQSGGYLGIFPTGLVDVSFIKKLVPTGQFLKDNGYEHENDLHDVYIVEDVVEPLV